MIEGKGQYGKVGQLRTPAKINLRGFGMVKEKKLSAWPRAWVNLPPSIFDLLGVWPGDAPVEHVFKWS